MECNNDLSCLSFTTKDELLKDQESFPPFGSNLCINVTDIQRIHETSGTTNKPLILALSITDIRTTIEIGAHCFKSAGLKKEDCVIHCLNYNMWSGGYTDHQSLEHAGASVIPFGVGNSHKLIETIILLRPSAIHCTPSYLKKLELVIRDDFKIEPNKLQISLGLFGAESGLQSPVFRKNIEDTWGMKAMNANYGLSDVLSIFGAECKHQKGLHFFGSEVLYPELIDPNTLKNISIKKGSIGELVLTNLQKEAQPLLRYRTNDVIKILSTDKCTCGNNGFIFNIVGRSDDMIVIKGLNVYINSIEKILNNFEEINTGIYQIYVNKYSPIDRMQIKIEINEYYSDFNTLKDSITKKIQNKIGITPEIELFSIGQLPRSEGKTRNLFKTL